jgi:hypothetical protein
MVMMKDIMWAFANAVSQVCVEDDGVSYRACVNTSLINSRASEFEKSSRHSNLPTT